MSTSLEEVHVSSPVKLIYSKQMLNQQLPLNPTMNKIFSIKSQPAECISYEQLHTSAATADHNFDSTSKYGIDTLNSDELDKVMDDIDLWGIDIFLIDELAQHRPLTAVAFNIFKVINLSLKILYFDQFWTWLF